MIFDTHSHYDDDAFNHDRDELLSGLSDRGVECLVNVGADMTSSRTALALAEQYDYYYVPAYFVGKQRLFSGAPEREDIERVYREALALTQE